MPRRPVPSTSLALLLSSAPLFAHDGEGDGHTHAPAAPVPEAVTYAPTGVPDRIVLTWAGDPATSQSVTWRTAAGVAEPVVQYAVATRGPQFLRRKDLIATIPADTQPLETDLGTAEFHSATMPDLEPAATYVYRVGDGTNWSEWGQFRTAADTAEPFTFVYFGDAQNEVKSMWSRVVRESVRDAPKAAFTLHAGDLINSPEADGEWGGWFYAGGWLNRTIPVVATPGNHEYLLLPELKMAGPGVELDRQLSRHWRPTFAFPEHGPEGLKETVYTFDYQGVRFVSLNSNERVEEQVPFLIESLEKNPHRWSIVTFHHPIYSSKAGRDNPALRNLWQPVFDEFGVDLVLNGHDHTYARTVPVTAEANQLEANTQPSREENVPTGVTGRSPAGTVYVVSVSGPKMYDLGDRPVFHRTAENTQLYQVITVDGDVLKYEARTAIGELYDGFTLTKGADGDNAFEEQFRDTKNREEAADRVGVEVR